MGACAPRPRAALHRGGIWGGAKIWSSEIWPLLRGELSFALQNRFDGNLHCVITPEPAHSA